MSILVARRCSDLRRVVSCFEGGVLRADTDCVVSPCGVCSETPGSFFVLFSGVQNSCPVCCQTYRFILDFNPNGTWILPPFSSGVFTSGCYWAIKMGTVTVQRWVSSETCTQGTHTDTTTDIWMLLSIANGGVNLSCGSWPNGVGQIPFLANAFPGTFGSFGGGGCFAPTSGNNSYACGFAGGAQYLFCDGSFLAQGVL